MKFDKLWEEITETEEFRIGGMINMTYIDLQIGNKHKEIIMFGENHNLAAQCTDRTIPIIDVLSLIHSLAIKIPKSDLLFYNELGYLNAPETNLRRLDYYARITSSKIRNIDLRSTIGNNMSIYVDDTYMTLHESITNRFDRFVLACTGYIDYLLDRYISTDDKYHPIRTNMEKLYKRLYNYNVKVIDGIELATPEVIISDTVLVRFPTRILRFHKDMSWKEYLNLCLTTTERNSLNKLFTDPASTLEVELGLVSGFIFDKEPISISITGGSHVTGSLEILRILDKLSTGDFSYVYNILESDDDIDECEIYTKKIIKKICPLFDSPDKYEDDKNQPISF